MHDIFISYSHKDKEWVSKLAGTLESKGYKVWWDKELLASQDFASMIEEALNASKCILTVWSSHSIKSKWVRAESSRGFNEDKLVPVYIDDSKIPIPYDSVHTIDLRNWDGDANSKDFSDLSKGLDWVLKGNSTKPKALLSTSNSSKNSSQPTAGVMSKLPFVLAGLAFVFGIGVYFAWKQSPTTPTPEPVSAETAKAQKACRPGSPNSIGKAAFAGNIDRVTECLTLLKSDSDVKNNDGWTALHSAAAGGYKAVAQKLYGSGYFDLEAKNNQN